MEIDKDILDNISKYADERRTICEVLREIYDLTFAVSNETVRDEIRDRLKIVYEMAKKMDKKLHEYKFGWDRDFWVVNKDYKKDLGRRLKRC